MAKKPTRAREAMRVCNVVPSRDTEKDWRFQHAVQSSAIAAPAALPASVDLRAAWWDIGDQEDTGSCVGWSSTDGVARYQFVKAGKLSKKEKLSPRFTWMASKETDEFVSRPETMIEEAGTSLKAAVDILRKLGAVPEKLLPFHISTKMYGGNENTFYATAASRRIASYFNLKKKLANWRVWLANNGPILVALNVDATWDNAAALRASWMSFSLTQYAAAMLSPLSDTRRMVASSYEIAGYPWGDKGFGYASEAYINGAFFNESYGVTL